MNPEDWNWTLIFSWAIVVLFLLIFWSWVFDL